MSDLIQKCMKHLKFEPPLGYLINVKYNRLLRDKKSGWGQALGVYFMRAVYLGHLCLDTNYQLFFITGFLVVLLFFSICDILQLFSPSWVMMAITQPFPLVWNWSLAVIDLYAHSYSPKSHLWFHFVSLSNQKMKSLAQRRQSAPSLIFVKALNRSRSVSRWVSEFCWQFLSPKLETFLSCYPHQVVKHNSGCLVAAQL